MTRSLRTIEAILTLTLDEARLALPELRHSLQQIDDMVTGVNDKFTAADRAMNATSAAITGWRDRIRERLGGLGRRRGGPQASQQWGSGNGQLKLIFKSRPRRLEVEVRSVPPRAVEQQQQAVRKPHRERELDYETIGLNMIRLFVDELRYQVDDQTGSLRMRMVKYLIE